MRELSSATGDTTSTGTYLRPKHFVAGMFLQRVIITGVPPAVVMKGQY